VQLHEALGVTVQFIYMLRSGRRVPKSTELAVRIQELTGIEPRDWFREPQIDTRDSKVTPGPLRDDDGDAKTEATQPRDAA
jgi:hypothetical protein